MSRSSECLNRHTAQAIAAGRCPKNELKAVRRHLAGCARCRAAVVAAAGGVRGPGDTIVLKRSGGAVRTALQLGAVAVSLLAAGGAWHYGARPKAEGPPAREVRVQAPLEPGVPSPHGDPPARPDVVTTSPTPTETAPIWRSLPSEPLAPEPAPARGPTVRVVTSAASAGFEPQPSRRRRGAPRSTKARRSSSREPAADERSQADQDVDFGIEEPATRRQRPGHRRTTRD